MSGFVASHRKIWESPIFKGNGARVGVWHWMLHMAAWKDTTQVIGSEVIDVRRGQLCVSQAQITEATGMPRQPLRTLLNLLEKTGAIAPQPATKATKGRAIITICNYEEYQAQQPNVNQTPTKRQPTKEQVNKETREAKASLDANIADILCAVADRGVVENFIGHRRDLKKPMTERAAVAMVKQLQGHHDPTAVFQASIASGWQGIFPEKIKPKFTAITGGQHVKPANKSQQRMDAFLRGAQISS
jgi:hypothetical protein